MDLTAFIRDVPDFPEPGIVFKDITPLLGNAVAFAQAIDALAEPFVDAQISAVAGIDARGFLVGVAAAQRLGVGFLPIRKAGKLPSDTHQVSYELEYGSDAVEIHVDACGTGDRILIVDDVLATGGTLAAAAECVSMTGAAPIGLAVLIELRFLAGRNRLPNVDFHTVIEVV